jgi:hypothetical protein
MRAKIFTTDSDRLSLMTLVDSFWEHTLDTVGSSKVCGYGSFCLACTIPPVGESRIAVVKGFAGDVHISLENNGCQSEGQKQRATGERKGPWAQFAACDAPLLLIHNSCQHSLSRLLISSSIGALYSLPE